MLQPILWKASMTLRGFGTPRVENWGTRSKCSKSLTLLFKHHFIQDIRVRDIRVGRRLTWAEKWSSEGSQVWRRASQQEMEDGEWGHGSWKSAGVCYKIGDDMVRARSTWLSSMPRTDAHLGHIPCGHFPLPAGWFFDCHLSWPILTPVLWTSMCLSFLTSAPAC